MTTEFKLAEMDKYGPKTGEMYISISKTQITLPETALLQEGAQIVCYISKNGDEIVIARAESGEVGYEVKKCGYGAKFRGIYCSNLITELSRRGTIVPQKARCNAIDAVGAIGAKLQTGKAAGGNA